MLARRLPGLLPPLSEAESLEVTRVHSVAGLLDRDAPRQDATGPSGRPHHTISPGGLVGGRQSAAGRARSASRAPGRPVPGRAPGIPPRRARDAAAAHRVRRTCGSPASASTVTFPARFQLDGGDESLSRAACTDDLCICGDRDVAPLPLAPLGSAAGPRSTSTIPGRFRSAWQANSPRGGLATGAGATSAASRRTPSWSAREPARKSASGGRAPAAERRSYASRAASWSVVPPHAEPEAPAFWTKGVRELQASRRSVGSPHPARRPHHRRSRGPSSTWPRSTWPKRSSSGWDAPRPACPSHSEERAIPGPPPAHEGRAFPGPSPRPRRGRPCPARHQRPYELAFKRTEAAPCPLTSPAGRRPRRP